MFHGIEIRWKHMPEDVYYSLLQKDQSYARNEMLKLLYNVNQIQAIEVTGHMREYILETFRNLVTPSWNPTTMYFAGDVAQTIMGQLLHMVLDHDTQVFRLDNETF